MMFMNEGEIEQVVLITNNHPVAAPYAPFAKFLHDWSRVCNENSDGWHSWPGGPKAAKSLMEGMEKVRVGFLYGRGTMADLPTVASLKKALGPIKACCTKRGLPCPTLIK